MRALSLTSVSVGHCETVTVRCYVSSAVSALPRSVRLPPSSLLDRQGSCLARSLTITNIIHSKLFNVQSEKRTRGSRHNRSFSPFLLPSRRLYYELSFCI